MAGLTNREMLETLLLRGKDVTNKIKGHLPLHLQALYNHYVLEGETIIDIANHLGRDRKTVRRWLKEMFAFIDREWFIDFCTGDLAFDPVSELVFVHVFINGEDLDTIDAVVPEHVLTGKVVGIKVVLEDKYNYQAA